MNNTDNKTPTRVTKASMQQLMSELRQLAPNRPLTYGESLAVARLQASKLRSWANAREPDINLVWLLNQKAVPVELTASHRLHEQSGVTTNAVGGVLRMFINEHEPAERQRFSLLHEFKHVLDFDTADQLHRNLGCGNREVQQNQIELICNEFAGQVLMPKTLVVKAWVRTQNLSIMANLFNVSAEAMKTRLEKLGLIGDKKPRPRAYFRLGGWQLAPLPLYLHDGDTNSGWNTEVAR